MLFVINIEENHYIEWMFFCSLAILAVIEEDSNKIRELSEFDFSKIPEESRKKLIVISLQRKLSEMTAVCSLWAEPLSKVRLGPR